MTTTHNAASNSGFTVKDSGIRAAYASGMVRDTQEGKARFDLLRPEGVPYEAQFLTRIAVHMALGAEKYGERNWEVANSQEEVKRFKTSAERHLQQYLAGEDDEDHAAAVFFNLLAAETTLRKIEEATRAAAPSIIEGLENLRPEERSLLTMVGVPVPFPAQRQAGLGPGVPLTVGGRPVHELDVDEYMEEQQRSLIGPNTPAGMTRIPWGVGDGICVAYEPTPDDPWRNFESDLFSDYATGRELVSEIKAKATASWAIGTPDMFDLLCDGQILDDNLIIGISVKPGAHFKLRRKLYVKVTDESIEINTSHPTFTPIIPVS